MALQVGDRAGDYQILGLLGARRGPIGERSAGADAAENIQPARGGGKMDRPAA